MLPGPLEQNIRNGQVHPESAATAVSHQTLTPDKQQLWKAKGPGVQPSSALTSVLSSPGSISHTQEHHLTVGRM